MFTLCFMTCIRRLYEGRDLFNIVFRACNSRTFLVSYRISWNSVFRPYLSWCFIIMIYVTRAFPSSYPNRNHSDPVLTLHA